MTPSRYFLFLFLLLTANCADALGQDRNKALDEITERSKKEQEHLKKELSEAEKAVDQHGARVRKLEQLRSKAKATQRKIIDRDLEKVKKLLQDATAMKVEWAMKLEECRTRYRQEERRLIVKQPMPDDPEYVEMDGVLFTPAELTEFKKQKAKEQEELALNQATSL